MHLPHITIRRQEIRITLQRALDSLRFLGLDIRDFCRVVYYYFERRLHVFGKGFEEQKNLVVDFLVAKRGNYQRPFLHTSVLVLIGAGVIGAPLIGNSYPTLAEELSEFTPPSAVISTLNAEEFATTTQKSDRPRDSVLSYTVKEGDTLSTVADTFGLNINTIKWANTDLKGEKLAIGQKINIPPVDGVVVKVSRGETVYSLAKKYQSEAQKIVNFPFNDFADLDTFALASGQTLVIPDGVPLRERPIFAPTPIQVGTIAHGNGQLSWPTQGLITQYPVSYHMALDIANASAPPIGAAESGVVSYVEYGRFGYGQHVIIDHGNGLSTLYAHMSEIYVKVGDSVGRGSIIGRMGSTGRSTGTHLHFEVRTGGVIVNPLPYLQ